MDAKFQLVSSFQSQKNGNATGELPRTLTVFQTSKKRLHAQTSNVKSSSINFREAVQFIDIVHSEKLKDTDANQNSFSLKAEAMIMQVLATSHLVKFNEYSLTLMNGFYLQKN